jgi:hypothetical protein
MACRGVLNAHGICMAEVRSRQQLLQAMEMERAREFADEHFD